MDSRKIKFVIDQIEIPREEVLRAIDRGIKQSSRGKINRHIFKKIFISSIVSASILGIILLSGFINSNMNQVLASTPLIGGIYKQFGDKMGLHLAEQNLVTELDQAITKSDVTVRLTSAYFDGNIVSITGHVSGNLDKGTNEEDELSFDMNFENNRGDNDPWQNGSSQGFRKTKDGYIFQWRLIYPHKEIINNFTLPISIHYINGIKGDWNFDIPVKQKKNKTKTINHSEEYKDEGIKININEIKLANASSSLLFETVSEYKGDFIDITKAKDNKGNVLLNHEMNIRLTQSKEEDGYHQSFRKIMNNIDEDVQEITIYPILGLSDQSAPQLLNLSPFTLNSKRSNLQIVVNNITQKDNKLILDYQFQGLASGIGSHSLDLLLNNLSNAFTLIDKDFVDEIDPENLVPPKNHSISINETKPLDKNTYQFQSVFQLEGENTIENFSLRDSVVLFDFSQFIGARELAPFTIKLPTQK